LGPGVGGKVLSSSRADDLDIGNDAMSVVDGSLKVYGVEHLRIADGSIMPRVTTGNTMAPCVIIGERAADALKAQHRL
jgi:choline dehydrogenase